MKYINLNVAEQYAEDLVKALKYGATRKRLHKAAKDDITQNFEQIQRILVGCALYKPSPLPNNSKPKDKTTKDQHSVVKVVKPSQTTNSFTVINTLWSTNKAVRYRVISADGTKTLDRWFPNYVVVERSYDNHGDQTIFCKPTWLKNPEQADLAPFVR